MAKAAWTRPGRNDVVTDRISGHSFGQPFSYTRQAIVGRGYSAGTAAVKSDHFHPTSRGREEYRMVTDNPFSMTVIDFHPYDGERGRTDSVEYISPQVSAISTWYPSDGFGSKLSNASARSVTKAREKLAHRDQMELGVAVLEAKTTADMLGTYASPLFRSLIAAKRGNWREIKDILKIPRNRLAGYGPSKWLEYQYGWRPLMNDCYTAYNRLMSDFQEPLLVFGNCWSPTELSYESSQSGFKVFNEESGGVRVKLCGRIQNSYARQMDSWGLINPLSVAWELVPFSFVLDWGIPIGNTLASITATAGLDFEYGFQSILVKNKWTITRGNSDATPWRIINSPGEYSFTRDRFDRNVLGGFPLPQIYGEEMPFSTARVKNALALAWQLFTGRR